MLDVMGCKITFPVAFQADWVLCPSLSYRPLLVLAVSGSQSDPEVRNFPGLRIVRDRAHAHTALLAIANRPESGLCMGSSLI